MDSSRHASWDLHALVAEDDPIGRRIVVRMLEGLGMRVDTAEHGRAAVDLARLHPYRLILMDHAMPELDGIDATQAIRALPNGHAPVICALSASAHPGHREACIGAGMDDYLPKPATLERLVLLLEHWFGDEMANSGIRETRPLDRDRMASLRDLAQSVGARSVADVVEMYLEDAPLQLEVLRAAVRDGDSATIERAAHRLRGSSETMGATAVSALCRELECASADGRLAPLRRLEVELFGAFAQLRAEVQRMLEYELRSQSA